MKQIKTFYAVKTEDIDKEVNEFIKDKKFIKIKFFYKDTHYYAVVIYEI